MKAIVMLFMILISSVTMAHNKVVVIPMNGDDVAPEPFAPVAKDSPLVSDYNIKAYTVTDNITGLEWQRIDDDTVRNWDDAWAYCLNLSLDGKENWRLPSASELMSIVDYGLREPAINGVAFPSTNAALHWSATTRGFPRPIYAWRVNFFDGGIYFDGKSASYYVRCVRSYRAIGPLLHDNNDGTVSDLATGLTWQQEDDNDRKTYVEAQSYCSNLDLGNKMDWRVPYVKELASIVEYRALDPAIDEAMFPSTDIYDEYWSATTGVPHPDTLVWGIDFRLGYYFHWLNKTGTYYVRCVHGG